jgi:hypothetical protein
MSYSVCLWTRVEQAAVRERILPTLAEGLGTRLDMETGNLLWSRLKPSAATMLSVTHLREALKRANRVSVLKDGRVEVIVK